MQFIDQSAAYSRKSITLEDALASGRARISTKDGSEKLAVCFRPELKVAISFDLDIDERVDFNALSTPDKMDLMIDDLIPNFFHPDLLPLTGKDVWYIRFIIDGTVVRTLRFDDHGMHNVSQALLDADPDVEVETDIVTLLALLRAEIAKFHHLRPPYPELPPNILDDDGDVIDDEVSGY